MKKPNPFIFSDSNKRYHTYDYYLRQKYSAKCAKVPLDAGLSCPNIDGTRGFGGCTYCSGRGSGDFCLDPSVGLKEQFDRQKIIYEKKWGNEIKFIPYYQAHTNTYCPIEKLKDMLDQAVKFDKAVCIAIATRADCITEENAALLREYSKKTDITVELGLQSVHDETAKIINRRHTYAEFLEGYKLLEGLDVCIHLIEGLPGEDRRMMIKSAEEVAKLSPKFVKFHVLHILKGTKIAADYEKGEIRPLSREEYVDVVVSSLERLPPETVIERVTGDGKAEDLLAPDWARKKFIVMNSIDLEFVKRDSMQGAKYKKTAVN